MKLQIAFLTAVISLLQAVCSQGTVHYVNLNSISPISPYSSWSTAATNIQDAVDVATNGDIVLVTNGVYKTGSQADEYGVSNRVAVTKSITLQSINGPAVTLIDGGGVVRCVYLTNSTMLIGFTLTNGVASGNGGGVWCEDISAVVSNCVLTDNSTASLGAGAYGGTLNNCTLTNNNLNGFFNAGGGAAYCTLNNCFLVGNNAINTEGGGAYASTLNSCLVSGNYAYQDGGGAYASTLNNCTLVNNFAWDEGAGADISTLNNCIEYYNRDTGFDFLTSTYNNCCTDQLPNNGEGNFTNAPLFVDYAGSDYHLQSNSPCINAGNNTYVTTTNDLDGNPRIKGGTVDIGAYEYQTPTSIISYAWLQQYGLPTDGSVDHADLDGNGMNVYQDWIAGLNPTNALSVLQMMSPMSTNNPPGLVVSWQSVNTRTYYLQSTTNLAARPVFSTIQSNIVGQAGTTSFTDTTATNGGPYFYRVGVQ